MNLDDLRFPIGKYKPEAFSTELLCERIQDIKRFPEKMQEIVLNLSDSDLHKTYRPDGWNVIQLVCHLADSHMNAFIRFMLSLTENRPIIKPYYEALWANSYKTRNDLDNSMSILIGLHARWSNLLDSMDESDFNKTLFHPEMNKELNLWYMLGLYQWHCEHHRQHIILATAQ